MTRVLLLAALALSSIPAFSQAVVSGDMANVSCARPLSAPPMLPLDRECVSADWIFTNKKKKKSQ